MKTCIRRQKHRHKKIRYRARLRRPPCRTIRVLGGFEMHHEYMQRLRKIRHRNLRLEKVPRKIRIRVAPSVEVSAMQIAL